MRGNVGDASPRAGCGGEKGQGFDRFFEAMTAYAALDAPTTAEWVAAGQTLGLESYELEYAMNPIIDEGEQLYALCAGLTRLEVGGGAATAAEWQAYLQS